MDILEGFIVCDTYKKKEILNKESKDFKNYIFLSIQELEAKVYGSLDNKALFVLMEEYNLSYELALEYIEYIPYVENKTYNDYKLDSIVSAKNLLIGRNLFYKDELFLYRLKQFPMTFIDIEDSIRLNRLKNIIKNYTRIYTIKSNTEKYRPVVYKFNTIYEETLFVFNKIIDLIRKGVSLNQIHLCNVDKDYAFLLERLAKNYNLVIDLPKKININSFPIIKDFYRLCDTKNSFRDILNELDSSSDYYKTIFNLIVNYNLENEFPIKYKSFFYEKFKSITPKQELYEEMISTKNQNSYLDSDYIFYLGLNLGVSPKVYKDERYLNDTQLEAIYLETSTQRNIESKNNLKKLLLTNKNIMISYKKYNGSEECFPSNIIDELKLEIKTEECLYGYSKVEDNLRLGILYTQYMKYKVLDSNLLKYNLSLLRYQEYNNKFKGLNPKYIEQKFKDKPLKMAYSNIKTYFSCPFSYYLDRILGLNEYKPSLATRLGTFSHAVLEDSYNDNFDFKQSVLKNTLEIAQDSKDKFYFSVMEEVLSSLLAYNLEHENLSMLKNIEREAYIEYIEDDFIFEGFIDKLMYTEIQGEIYAAIIDYKTGKDIISLDNVYDGFHLQLPCYMFLLSKYKKFEGKKIHIIGIYLQKVNIISLDNTIDIVSQREKQFKLQGFSVKNTALLSMLDPNYDKSSYIMSLSTLKSGEFSRYAKLITEDEEQELITLVDELIHKVNKEIREAKFDISPKLINQKNESCMFCKYKDICYMKYEDLLELEYKPFPKGKTGEE